MYDPKPFGLNELREMFLTFFEGKDHLRLPSFSLVPQDNCDLFLSQDLTPSLCVHRSLSEEMNIGFN